MRVKNYNGTFIDYEAATVMMDEEIREKIHMELAPCSEQEFFSAYEEAHLKAFGEEWELSKQNPCY